MRKVVGGFGKKSCVSTGVRKAGNICVTDRHDMTLAVKVALNPNTTNQPFPKQTLVFTCLHCKSLENTVRKEKIARYEHISPFPTVFSTLFKNFQSFSSHLKLLSANCFNLDQSKILSSGNGLTVFRTISTLTTLTKKAFENIEGKGGNAGYHLFLLFSQCFQKASSSGSLKYGIVW